MRLLNLVATAPALVALCLLASLPARAEEPTAVDARLWAARACYVEASFRADDCAALLWVAQKRARRAGRLWLDMLRDYSAVEADTRRASEARAFPWGDVPNKPAAFNRHWGKLRALATDFAAGKLRDPCPKAEHWGGAMDVARGRMVPARCAAITANTFYAVARGARGARGAR